MTAICAVVTLVSLAFQPQIAVNGGQGWDGRFYYRIADEIHSGQPIVTEAPFVYCVLVPFAAAMIVPHDLMLGFIVVNALAIAATIVLMVVWLRLYLDSWLIRVVLIGIGLQELMREPVPAIFVVVLMVTQAISERLFWILPAAALEWEQVSELVLLTPIGNNVSVYNVTAWDAEPIVRAVSQVEYGLVMVVLFGLLFWMRRRQARRTAPPTAGLT